MSPEIVEIVVFIALFVLGIWFGIYIGLDRREQEVREWQAIARKAQNLNRIAMALHQERSNGSREHENIPDGDDQP